MHKPFEDDSRIILTLDAGGTNFNFAAIKNAKILGESVNLSVNLKSLEDSLEQITSGFSLLIEQIKILGHQKPSAISFAFPGPCDYVNGVTLNEGNLPAFSGGVALGPYLQYKFKIPVYINNDGDLYAYGEANFGLLKQTQFTSLVGITLGTGVGGGFCHNGIMLRGETSNALEVWTVRNGIDTQTWAEEGLGKRALINFYGDQSLTPKDIADIADGITQGNQNLAIDAFKKYGQVLGELIADLVTLFDAPVVLGGGVVKSHHLFSKAMLDTIGADIIGLEGKVKKRIVQDCYLVDSVEKLNSTATCSSTLILGTDIEVSYNQTKQLPIFIGLLDTNTAVQLGAYAFALNALNH